ncbi:restriction endonuclease subunit S [Collinsella sp. An2]|uniref:restriction endonuclease subunit S n=1 Tax=Collinsella sp. An2 TaxID=1965585 RepID=UPI0013023E7E|nr:restriction endonuclease subunit S [Collinsella sp. An2]
MTATTTNSISAITTCLEHAAQLEKRPINIIDPAGIVAGILPALLPFLPEPPEIIRAPFNKSRAKESTGRIVLCVPPVQETLSASDESVYRTICTALEIKPPRLTFWLFAALALYFAGPKGIAMVLMPQTALSRSAWRMGQQDFIDHRLIEAVIALPDTISAAMDDPYQPPQHRPSTVAYDSLVILSRPENRAFADSIAFILPDEVDRLASGKRFADQSDMLIPYEDVKNSGYLLTPLRYRGYRPTFSNGVRLRDVATVTRGIPKTRLRGIRLLTVSSLGSIEPTLDNNAPVAYLTSKDFEHGYDYCHLTFAGMHLSSSFFAAKDLETINVSPITTDNILLSRTGAPFKVCRLGRESFEHPASAYLIADNLYCIQPKPRLNPDYLLAFLSSTLGQQALCRTANSATTMQQISPNDLRDMFIPLPPITEQHDIANRYLTQLNEIAEMKHRRAELNAERDRWFSDMI